jgi:hypothetical protein
MKANIKIVYICKLLSALADEKSCALFWPSDVSANYDEGKAACDSLVAVSS